jgi:hypothetical protein
MKAVATFSGGIAMWRRLIGMIVSLVFLTTAAPIRADYMFQFANDDDAGTPQTNFVIENIGGEIVIRVYLVQQGPYDETKLVVTDDSSSSVSVTSPEEALGRFGLSTAGVMLNRSDEGIADLASVIANSAFVVASWSDPSIGMVDLITGGAVFPLSSDPNSPDANRILLGRFTFRALVSGTTTLTAEDDPYWPNTLTSMPHTIVDGEGVSSLDPFINSALAQITVLSPAAVPEPSTLVSIVGLLATTALCRRCTRRRR